MSCSHSCLRANAPSHDVRQLTLEDLDAIKTLQRDLKATLSADLLQLKEEYEITAYLNETMGAAFGVFDDHVLSAMALIRIPSAEYPNLLPPLPYVPKHDCSLHTAFLENAIVAPATRGRGYQRMLVDMRMAHAKAVGMRWVGAGARLGNVISWRNLLASNMAIVALRITNGQAVIGLLRPLIDDTLPSSIVNRRLVAIGDTDGHLHALESGYIGTRLTTTGFVVYQLSVS
jgi:ribosomal protein S18 acetylase RimI-like enzyme